MSDIQIMNSQMLEIIKNYLEIYTFFNEKLEEIKADEILNVNLELLKASILDLNINISNFKSDLQSNQPNQPNQPNPSLASFTELDKKNFLALFFMYLMQIDKDSILNRTTYNTNNKESMKESNKVKTNNNSTSNNSTSNNSTSNNSTSNNSTSNNSTSNNSTSNNINTNKKIYDDPELD